MAIPLINFRPHQASFIELEVINLNSIYDRTQRMAHDPASPHRLTFFHFIFITQGVGSHFIDFNKYPYQEGCVIFINKHQIHAFDFKHSPEGKVVLFTQQFLDQTNTQVRMPFFASNLMNVNAPVLTLNNTIAKSCASIINEIEKELSKKQTNPLIVQFLFSALLLILDRERPTGYLIARNIPFFTFIINSKAKILCYKSLCMYIKNTPDHHKGA